jgi:uncharacterized protein with PIN domain
MTFECKRPNDGYVKSGMSKIVHPYEVQLSHSRNMYDHVKYCKVCAVFLLIDKKRCPCCNAPLRCKSKRAAKLLRSKTSTRSRIISNSANKGTCC